MTREVGEGRRGSGVTRKFSGKKHKKKRKKESLTINERYCK